MADPTGYTVVYSFGGFQNNSPATPLPAPALDNELDDISASIASIVLAVKDVRRADGLLNNGIVTFDSLSNSLQTAGLAPAAAWLTGVTYPLNANAIQAGALYRCRVPHTAGVFATDLAAGDWTFVANLAAAFSAGANLQLVGSVISLIPSPALSGVPTAPTAAAGNNSLQIATTAYLDGRLAVANGIATLDGSGKLTTAQIPAALVGAVQYQGTWNASTNSPALVSSTGTKGFYYKVSVAGGTAIDGNSQWNAGDSIIFDGATWDKIDGIANEVLSVAGKTGVVTLAFTDITGSVAATQMPALTGDVTTVAGAVAATIVSHAVTNAKMAQAGAATLKMNATAGTADLTDLTIQGLTNLAAPSATLDFLVIYDHVSGTLKSATPGAIAASSVAGVSSYNTRTGSVVAAGTDVPLRSYLAGLTLSTAGASATFGIAAGVATDSTNTAMMALAAFTKTTAAWALGTAAGSFDGTGAAPTASANWYHVHLIRRPDTGVVDVLTSLSATAPTLPTNYTQFRRIGSMKTNGSFQWILFSQVDDTFIWAVPLTDANAIPTTAARVLTTLTVPTGVVVTAKLRMGLVISASAVATLVSALTETDAAVAYPNCLFQCTVTNQTETLQTDVQTNASAQVGVRSSNALGTFSLVTYGWIDTRGALF